MCCSEPRVTTLDNNNLKNIMNITIFNLFIKNKKNFHFIYLYNKFLF